MSRPRPDPASTAVRPSPIVAGVLVAGVLIAVIVLFASGSFGASDDVAARTAELERAELERDQEQVGALNVVVEQALSALGPVLDGLDAALPAEGGSGAAAVDQAALVAWGEAVDDASARFADPPSGGTQVNVARSGFGLALDQLSSAVALLETAMRTDGELRSDLYDQAADLRSQAVVAWSIAATQLDVVNIEVGNGHVHHYLPAAPGSGAFTPDGGPATQHEH